MKNRLIYIRLSLLVFFLALFACQNESKNLPTKILGKIINPKKTEIVISKDPFNVDSDTLFVKSGNKFSGEVNINKEGLKYIYIFPEFQVIYLKPGDSLAFVLNTTEFDESLSFSGTSGFENNLLIELFLANEKENIEISRKMRQLSPEELNKKLDSFYQFKQKLIRNYKDSYSKTSLHYKEIIDLYNHVAQYRIKENYIISHPDSLPEGFKKHRKLLKQTLVDPNLPDLLYFAKAFVDNKLREKKIPYKKIPTEAIGVINDEIKDPGLKDNILMIYCKNYIINRAIVDPEDSVFKRYMKSIQNPLFKKNCLTYIHKNKMLAPGMSFPSVKLRDVHHKEVNLNELLRDHKNLISYWDLYFNANFKSNLKKFNKIQEEYPDLQIIILNDNPDDFQEWRLQIPQNNDFIFLQMDLEESEMDKFIPYGLNQVFLLDSTKIKYSFINLYNKDFSKKVKAFINE